MEANHQNRALLSVEDLEVRYVLSEETVCAVNGVSFTVNKGETLGLVGETGAGKTTIAKAIMSILPDPPAKIKNGKIMYGQKDLLAMKEKEVRKIRGKKISMIFQDPMTALNPVFTVGEQIAEVVKIHENLKGKESIKRAVEMLEMVGIPGERYGEYPHQFSGRMKQRVVIAMALACNPELLIADEPTTALDVTIQAQVLEMMTKLKEQLNTAMILITHDLGIVAQMCDKVAIVYAGEIVETGSAEDIFDRPAHPYTTGLFNALPSLADDQTRLTPIHGLVPDPTALPKGCKFHTRCPYASEACEKTVPPLKETEPGHYTRCSRGRKEAT
ncbi:MULTISPECIES: ABC transporter ATP-binding protein [Hungatella]|uniref:Dipeptide/oligopeptide/nickel ABC transporter ATP-binding protein n=1 Tax=Hungatella hathewayi TaxID=154046 RepID=A0AA37JF23_9FIRM|nr:ABC transporter ATP-binding protein [Hungatella hathewayi]MBS6756490.1 ABC transporter ATP-binding protein [Hungatella hathewayi]MBT9795342.1 ATP-binding cassette domain-containing protein [Hungatella hathewayi]RGZ02977.1 ABC transporter ATP-binding protein [Hungatella hathewayi]GKG99883.1 dipeptide/oligopeptide/nickel ABC transporter ATP-binding protein [Hungatella hathewayi]GKH06706.1 dipeptide/oligopeptide/nickel ABC transporter ATP-binding protein [Hungatella hathewayi]